MQVLRLVAKVNTENFYRRKYDLLYLDTCYGDSGGPLMTYSSNKQWVLVGVTSGGYECGHAGIAGVYTRVTSYLYWINETISTCDPFGDPPVTATNKTEKIITTSPKSSICSQSHSSHFLLIVMCFCLFYFSMKRE